MSFDTTMKFEQIDNIYYFILNGKKYKVQPEDIERLRVRPGTRVLRFLDEENQMVSLPLTIPVGEVEGYMAMLQMVKK